MAKKFFPLAVIFSCLFLFSMNAFATAITAQHDLNVDVIKSAGSYLSPGVEAFTIVWWYRDSNFLTATHDVNVEVFVSQNTLDKNLTLLNDANAVLYCGSANGTDINFGAITRCTYNWNATAPLTDTNYLFDVNMYTYASAAVNDMNRIRKHSDNNFTLDQNAPSTMNISSPSVTNSKNYNLTYTSTDALSGIAEYYVSDSPTGNFLSNGTNTSYSFALGSYDRLPATRNYYVKSRDVADNNSATAMISVLFDIREGGGGGGYCGDGACNVYETSVNCSADCSAVCGDRACTREENYSSCPSDCPIEQRCGDDVCSGTETVTSCPSDCSQEQEEEVLFERTKTFTASSADVELTLDSLGFETEEITTAKSMLSNISVQRKVKAIQAGDDFSGTFTLVINNKSNNSYEDLKILEQIPKTIAENASEIESNYSFEVLEEDPVIIFNISSIQPGESREVSYTVNKNVTEDSFDEYGAPIALSGNEVESAPSCAGIICNDNNPCTQDSCSAGQCRYLGSPNGTSCGVGKQCQSGACVNVSGQTQPVQQQPDYTLPIIVVLAIVAVAGYWYYTQRK